MTTDKKLGRFELVGGPGRLWSVWAVVRRHKHSLPERVALARGIPGKRLAEAAGPALLEAWRKP